VENADREAEKLRRKIEKQERKERRRKKLERQRVRMADLYAKRRRAGLCPQCGRKALFGYVQCDDHVREDRERKRKRMREMRAEGRG